MAGTTIASGDPNNPVTPPTTPQPGYGMPGEDVETEVKDKNKLFVFQQMTGRLGKLINSFETSVTQRIINNREMRNIDIDLTVARLRKDIEANDVMILLRVIDSNIRREQPPYIQFFKQPERLAGFTDILTPSTNTKDLENEFTRGMTYLNWDLPLIKTIDAAQTHGWSSLEVVFDETKPYQVGLEFIDTEFLIIDQKTKDIQNQEIVLRKYEVVPRILESFVTKFGFNKVEVDKLLKELRDEEKEKPICIYKKFCKYEGIVYVSWFSLKCQDWLKAPAPLFLGTYEEQTVDEVQYTPMMGLDGLPITDELGEPAMQEQVVPVTQVVEKPITNYPIFPFIYEVTENSCIVESKGRVFKDKYKQEAMTANLSAFCSACLRSADVLATPTNKTDGGSKMEGLNLSHGSVTKDPVSFYNPPAPNAQMLQLSEYLEAFNAEDAGRPTYAVQKKSSGSRVTAEQVKSARQDQVQLNALQVTSFASFLREVWSFSWDIVQNRAMFDKFVFLYNEGLGGNDKEIISRAYDIRAAGDVDVIRKNELLELYEKYLPIVVNTPAAGVYVSKMLSLAFGREGQQFISLMQAGDPIAVLGALLEILKVTLDPEEIPQDPVARQQLQTLLVQAEQIVANAAQANPTAQNQSQPQGQQNSPQLGLPNESPESQVA